MPQPAIPASERPLRSACLKPAKEKYFSFCYRRFGVTCCLHNVFVNTETSGFSKTLVTQLQTTACYTNYSLLHKPQPVTQTTACYTNHSLLHKLQPVTQTTACYTNYSLLHKLQPITQTTTL